MDRILSIFLLLAAASSFAQTQARIEVNKEYDDVNLAASQDIGYTLKLEKTGV